MNLQSIKNKIAKLEEKTTDWRFMAESMGIEDPDRFFNIMCFHFSRYCDKHNKESEELSLDEQKQIYALARLEYDNKDESREYTELLKELSLYVPPPPPVLPSVKREEVVEVNDSQVEPKPIKKKVIYDRHEIRQILGFQSLQLKGYMTEEEIKEVMDKREEEKRKHEEINSRH